jgi:hypothetical protein
MEKSSNLPFYVKCSQVIMGLVAVSCYTFDSHHQSNF